MTPRLVATDLDGTIVGADEVITDRTVAALKSLEALGVPVVFVTGRPARWMADVARRTGHTGVAVCANGALLYDLHREQVLEHFPISVEVGLDVARRLRKALPDIAFAVETLDGFAHEESYLARWDVGQAREVADIERIYGQPAVKLLARHEAMGSDALLAAAREVAGDLVQMTHSSMSGLLEISAAGVSKATTLARVCAGRGIEAADVVAFGDMPNDLPMLAWAGLSYGVAGGHPEVLAAADRIVPGPESDGVAIELERLFAL
ncbi:MAG: Cof-type HAD-IIB family hydrolase [Spirochaetaceae bacterium]|nr:Cof-type HAD-IIB family hydrolase [Spirochaetaceae bacterium]